MSELDLNEPRAYISYPSPHLTPDKYVPVDTWASTRSAVGYASVFGLLTVATQNAVAKERLGPLGIITRSGGLWSMIVLVSGTYKLSSSVLSNLREKKDTLNEFYAGAIAGAVAGLPTKSLVKASGWSFAGGIITALVYWSGSIVGQAKTSSYAHRGVGAENNFKPKSDVQKQEFWDVLRRRPLSQTLEELGEGAFKP
jgi:hypothetical protein